MHPIERYRRGRGLTQEQLAATVGVSVMTIRRWEGGAEPRPGHLRKLAEALGLDSLTLFSEIETWRQEEEGKEAA